MRSRITCALLAAFISLAVPAEARGPARAELIESGGCFHGDEMPARNNQTWLGLFVNGPESTLETVTIRVVRCHDPIIDDDEHARTGRSVSVPGRREPVFLVRNLPEVKPSVATTVHSYYVDLVDKSDITLSLGDTRYRLWVESTPTRKRLRLSRDGLAQTLYSARLPSADEGWSLKWAGDVDGDGKLDLYVDASHHYNLSESRLFLSSRSRRGTLVGLATVFRTSGC